MVRRGLSTALGLLSLLASAPAGAQPVLLVSEDERRLEISSLSLDYRDGQVQAKLTFARGGTIEAQGSWRDRILQLELVASQLAAEETDPWLLRAGPPPLASGRLSGEATLRWEPGQPVRLDTTLGHDQGTLDWVGIHFRAPFQARGAILIGDGTTLRDLQIVTAQAKLGGLEFSDLACVVQLEDKQLRLEKLRGQGYGALWRGETEWDFRERTPRFRIALDVEDELAGESYEFAPSEAETGARIDRLTGGVRASGRWTGDETWRNTLQGSGLLLIRGGEVRGSPIMPAVWQALASRVPLLKLPRLSRRIIHPNELIEGRMSFELRDAAVHSEDVYVETGDFVAEGSARLGFDETIDAPLVVSLTQQGIERMFAQVALPLPRTSLQLGRIPVRVTGTWSEPEAKGDAGRVPRSVVRMIFGYAVLP
jgi:hypothetical protein